MPEPEGVSMIDEQYLLMKQCIVDSIAIHEKFGGDDWEGRFSDARELFKARLNNPMTMEVLEKMLTAGYNAEEALKEVEGSYGELGEIQKQIIEKTKELQKVLGEIEELKATIDGKKKELDGLENVIQETRIKAKAEDFLATTIGQKYAEKLKAEGRLDILVTNGAVYRVTEKGEVAKYTKNKIGSGFTRDWSGRVAITDMPMYDCVATVIVHIMTDSDRFDKDKACGSIHITSD
jgi:hypothetical protein